MLAQIDGNNRGNLAQCGPRNRANGESCFKAASLFTGIGGFDIGLERAGFEITFQCEINKFCRSILKRHWPKIPHHENIKELHASDIPQSDVWTGGFPCQDVSLARMGARAGLRGNRSGLFYEVARLLGEACPRVILLENVPGLLNSHQGRDFGIVIGTLAESGILSAGVCLTAKTSESPNRAKESTLSGVIKTSKVPERFFLKPNAAKGMLN